MATWSKSKSLQWLKDTLKVNDDDAEGIYNALQVYGGDLAEGGEYADIHKGDSKYQKEINYISKLLQSDNTPTYSGTVYRGLYLSKSDADKLKKGGVWTEPGITSFSEKEDIAQGFAVTTDRSKVSVVFKMDNKRGVQVSQFMSESENELLHPGGAFKIKSVKQSSDRWGNKILEVVLDDNTTSSNVDQGARDTDSALSAMEKRIRSVYAEAQKDIEKKTKDFWNRHKTKDAVYRKQLQEGKITEEQYQSWMRGQVFQGKQWDAKLQQIESTLAQANKDALEIINGGRIQVFTDNSNWTAYSIEHEAGVNFGFGVYDADTVTRLLRDNPNLLPAKKLNVPKDKIWNKGNINRQISQGIIQGESLDKIAKRLRNVTDMNKSQSLTNARTMMTGAQNAGRQESYVRAQKMGIELQKEWLATLDGHTRMSHAQLDGQAVDIDKPFKVDGYTIAYPGDPHAKPFLVYNCRCTTIARLVKYPHKGKRYDNIAGKPIKDMTYQQWIKAKTTPQFTQASIGACKTVQAVADLINASGHFITASNLDGCDLNSAKAIASAYQQTIEKFPQLSGKIGGVTAKELNNRAYAQCYIHSDKRIEVNTVYYNDWDHVQEQYDYDVNVGWHPPGTTAEAIVTHEIGHAIDGILSDANQSWDFKGSKISKTFANGLRAKVAQSTGVKIKDMGSAASTYASQNAQEWFAECYAEYITSANPRRVAKRFGQLLEEELKKL